MSLPDAITSALADRGDNALESALEAGPARGIRRGDVRLIDPLPFEDAERRLVLVLRSHGSENFAEVLLAHSTVELACELDAVVHRSFVRASYDLVIQTDVRGVVWTNQLGRRVGHLAEPHLHALSQIAQGVAPEARSPGVFRGTPLAGPIDRRWPFKEAEGRALARLAADCTEALLSGDSPWEIDGGLLNPRLLDRVDDQESFLLELMHVLTTREHTIRLSLDDLLLLESVGALERETWLTLGYGPELWDSVKDIFVIATTEPGIGGSEPLQRLITTTALPSGDEVERSYLEVHFIGQKEPVTA